MMEELQVNDHNHATVTLNGNGIRYDYGTNQFVARGIDTAQEINYGDWVAHACATTRLNYTFKIAMPGGREVEMCTDLYEPLRVELRDDGTYVLSDNNGNHLALGSAENERKIQNLLARVTALNDADPIEAMLKERMLKMLMETCIL